MSIMRELPFKVVSDFKPTGDQPAAIESMLKGLQSGENQVLEGVTGSGKTFTMAHVIEKLNKPTLVISHNKTLAAQLYAEFKTFFPNNAVSYFVSYFDYYQPEAYIPRTDTFIEKDSAINEDVERLRLAATDALLNRKDVIVVASVSCIYGLGSPEDYKAMMVELEVGQEIPRDRMLEDLVAVQYERNEVEKRPGTFRVRGDVVEIYPSYKETGYRIEFFGDEIEAIHHIEPLTGKVLAGVEELVVSPAKHFVTPYAKIEYAIKTIKAEMEERVAVFDKENKLLEAQRIKMRTEYDLEMLQEMGFCSGIENYSRHLTGRKPGERPYTLIDFFGDDFLTIIDESHVSVPQLNAMYNGDQARKGTLVEHGFRLPSAMDNRPLQFNEFKDVTRDMVYVSATPGPYELQMCPAPIPQIIRPTGITDPDIEIRPLKNQVDDLIEEVRTRAELNERVLVTTLTKRVAEDLTDYLHSAGLRVKYLHSDVSTLERVAILRALRRNEFDCLIGINLLREGLDLPEVTLVAVLDADKEGFLRSRTSLIQTAGRAARNAKGKVILYAEHITESMQALLDVTCSRREKQLAYNEEHGITPKTIIKAIEESLLESTREEPPPPVDFTDGRLVAEGGKTYGAEDLIKELEGEMKDAAKSLEYERAAMLRDQIMELRAATGDARPKGTRKKGNKAKFKYPKRKR